jgi:hypothetical protein
VKFEAEAVEAACRADLGVWTELKLELMNAPFQWEWCDLAMTKYRLGVVAPREHAKSQVFAVNQSCWRAGTRRGSGRSFSPRPPTSPRGSRTGSTRRCGKRTRG